jgi:hypothetical protein
MGAKTNTSANDYVALIYNATAIANIADNAATSPLTQIFIAAHTADIGPTGVQNTSEAAYTGYARATPARTTGGFTCSTGVVTLVANASFGACTAGSATLTHWSTGVASSGATKVLHRGVFGSRLGPFTGATTNTITLPGTTLAVDDRIVFYSVLGSSLPTGIAEGTVYWVKTASGADITVSTTQGGAAVTITVAGDGIAYRVTPIAVSAGVTPQLAAGAIIYEE